jgi:hypothetical protein
MNINSTTARRVANDLVHRAGSITGAIVTLIDFSKEFTGYDIRDMFSAHMGGVNDQAIAAVRAELDSMI